MKLRRRSQAGFTLIEMMVAVLISMIMSIAVMLVLSTFEGRRRTLGSTSDLDQTGALAMFQIDRWVRSAGTGLIQNSTTTYGCRVLASLSGTTILPSGSLPAPFASVNPGTSGVFRLAPILILPGQTTPGVSGQASDALVVMASGNDAAQVPSPLTAPPTASSLTLANLTEFSPKDLVLIADTQPSSTGGPKDCMVSQASNSGSGGAGTALALGGTGTTYYNATISSTSITSYTQDSAVFDLGASANGASGAPASFQVIGVGDNNTLYSYDLLNIGGATSQSQADGVFEMHALYGVPSVPTSSTKVDTWINPATSTTYSLAALSAGNTTASGLLKNIRAVRVGLILRTSLPEKGIVTPGPLTMFADLPAAVQFSRSLSTAEQHYRYRVVETTIPVRNNNF